MPDYVSQSQELACIINLHNVAIYHKLNCDDEACDVSLYQLRLAAGFIKEHMVRFKERKEAQKYIDKMPIS